MPIRLRLALIFALLVAVAFAAGGWLFEAQLSSGLQSLLDSQLTAQLAQVDRYLTPVGQSPEPRRAASSVGPAPGEYFFQLLDQTRRVRGASTEAGTAPLLNTAQLLRASTAQLFVTTTVEGERARLSAVPYRRHMGWVAVGGASLDTLDRTVSDVTRQLIIGGIAAVIVAAFGAYLLARAALSPVERLRREVAALGAHDRRAVVAVPRTRDEIAALARTMNELLGRLHEVLARQRALVADAGHELRNPFAILQAELELAGRPGRTPEELRSALRVAADEVRRLSRLADDLLFLARSDEGQIAIRTTLTALGPLVGESVIRVGSRLEDAGLQCQIDVPDGLTAVIDPDRIRQVMDNLLDNALRFAPRGSSITIGAHGDDNDDLVLYVSDRGPGFPSDYLPHAFERFRRPDAGRARDHGGAGLGLSIVHAIAAAHNGTAEAHNRPGGGAHVQVTLPGAMWKVTPTAPTSC